MGSLWVISSNGCPSEPSKIIGMGVFPKSYLDVRERHAGGSVIGPQTSSQELRALQESLHVGPGQYTGIGSAAVAQADSDEMKRQFRLMVHRRSVAAQWSR